MRERPHRLIERASRLPGRANIAYLAEDYDGIGQYVMVTLARSSSSNAYKAKVAAGDFGGGRVIPAGTKVPVFSARGRLEVLLGNHPGLCIEPFTRVEEHGLGTGPFGTWVTDLEDAENFPTVEDGHGVLHQALRVHVPVGQWGEGISLASGSGNKIELLVKFRPEMHFPDAELRGLFDTWNFEVNISEAGLPDYAGFWGGAGITWFPFDPLNNHPDWSIGSDDNRGNFGYIAGENEPDESWPTDGGYGQEWYGRFLFDEYGTYARFWLVEADEPVTTSEGGVPLYGGRGETWQTWVNPDFIPDVLFGNIELNGGASGDIYVDFVQIVQPCKGGRSSGLSSGSTPVVGSGSGGDEYIPPPPPIIPPSTPPGVPPIFTLGEIVGWGDGTTGGESATPDHIYDVSTWAEFKAALLKTHARIIRLHGSTNFNGGGSSFNIDFGNLTVDGSDYTGDVYNYKMVFRCSNVIIQEMAFRVGEGTTASASADRRSICFNAGNSGGVIRNIVFDHCSFAWGPDVIASFLNNVEYATVQYSMVGPALFDSNISSAPNGYGFNTTVPGNSNPNQMWAKHLTFYRNFYVMCAERMLKFEHSQWVDAIENVVYDWGDPTHAHGQCPVHGNSRGVNVVSNMFKRGPESGTSTKAFEEDDKSSQYPDSTYHDGNIGITAAGGSYTLDWSGIDGSALRSTPYGGGLSVAAGTADLTLFAAVVANAGRTHQDSIDTLMKTHAMDGTSDGFYNGAGLPAPHPFHP